MSVSLTRLHRRKNLFSHCLLDVANPYFLVRGMSASLRLALEIDSSEQDEPIQEIMRQILCEHYDLDCPQLNHSAKREDAWEGSTTVLLKMTKDLYSALREDSEESGESMQALCHQALEAHYAAVT